LEDLEPSAWDMGEVERKSRRDILIGAAGGAAVLASGAIQRIPAAQAANGDPLLLGQANNATAKTSLSVNDPVAGAEALEVIQTVISRSAIVAKARPEGGVAIVAEGGSGGMSGASLSTAAPGVYGEDRTLSSLGRGVSGYAENGWGVTATSPNGQALRVSGRATFDRSGRVTISFPNKTATVSVPGRWDTSTGFPNRPSLALAPNRSSRSVGPSDDLRSSGRHSKDPPEPCARQQRIAEIGGGRLVHRQLSLLPRCIRALKLFAGGQPETSNECHGATAGTKGFVHMRHPLALNAPALRRREGDAIEGFEAH
jgi:hypothetical protein